MIMNVWMKPWQKNLKAEIIHILKQNNDSIYGEKKTVGSNLPWHLP